MSTTLWMALTTTALGVKAVAVAPKALKTMAHGMKISLQLLMPVLGAKWPARAWMWLAPPCLIIR
jgi:hypothetical protein